MRDFFFSWRPVASQNKQFCSIRILIPLLILFFCGLATPGYGQTPISVTSTADSGPGTLREAITTANGNPDFTYLITLPANQTITLTSALPNITFSGTIAGGSTLCPATGAGGSTIARTGSAEFRLLKLYSSSSIQTLTLMDLTLRDGLLTTGGEQIGGVVAVHYNLTVKQCLFRNNTSIVGALYKTGNGELVVEDSFFEDNSTTMGRTKAISCEGQGQKFRIERTVFRQSTDMTGYFVYFAGTQGVVRNCAFQGTPAAGMYAFMFGTSGYPTSVQFEHNTFEGAAQLMIANGFSGNVNVLLQNNVFGQGSTGTNLLLAAGGPSTSATFTSLGGNVFANNITSNLTLLASDKDNVGTAGLGLGSLTTVAGECIPVIPLGCFSQAIDAAVSSTLTTDALGISQIGTARDAGAYESSNAASVTFTVASPAAVCMGSMATLTASGCTGGTANWPGGITGNTYSTSVAGTYIATCTIGTCTTTASGTVTNSPTSYTITSLANSGAGSLRQVFADIAASSCTGQFTITFGVSGTVNLASTLTAPAKDILLLGYSTTSTDVVLQGGGASSNYRILTVPGSATLSIRYLSFTNARVGAGQNGGAISLDGGRLQLAHCYLYGNTASNLGGALYHGGGSFTITNSTFASNTAINNSGALHKGTSSPGLIENCTFSGNVARAGGAIEASVGSLTINNSTFTLNRAVGSPSGADGGAIYGSGTTPVVINNCLIVGNSTLGAGPDLISLFNSTTGYNLIGTSTGYTLTGTTTGNIISVSAEQYRLGSLGNYGGATPTHALLPGSLAIDAGSPSGAPTTDQRGISRVGTADIGAFESQGFSLAISSGNNQSAFPNTAFANPLRVSVSSANGEPVEGGIVSFSAPVSGPSATLSSTTVTISSGTVAVNATANATAGGPYSVMVGTTGAIPVTVAFSLTNSACPPALIPVTSTADSGPGTLREAITNANANVDCGPYLITLPANQTISLTAALPDILFSGTIAGGSTLCPATGVGGSTIARYPTAGELRFLSLTGSNKTLAVADIQFLNGLLTTAGTAGGAIYVENSHSLTVQRCVFRNNRASFGGAIYTYESDNLVVEDSYFDENSSGGTSAISTAARTARIDRTTFRQVTPLSGIGNSVFTFRGTPSALVRNCNFGGGATINQGYVIHCLGSSSNPVSATIQHTTFGLSAESQIYTNAFLANVSVSLQNTVFAAASGNNALETFNGAGTGNGNFTSMGGNVFANDITANLTLLASDKDNVGTTGLSLGSLTALSGECIPTIPLLPGSAAINAGVSTTLTTDARGISRVSSPDAGSFESRGFALAVTSGNNQSAPVNTAFANPLRVSVSSANGEPVEGGVVSFSARASGASAILSSTTATISSGTAAVNATANATLGGPYNVSATSAGSSTTVQFALTNAAACVYSYTANLNDTGAGSLRNVLATIGTISGCTGQFTVTFAQSGTVNLASGLSAPTNKDILIEGPFSTTTSVTLRGGERPVISAS